MAETAVNKIWPKFRVYRPSGTLLCSSSSDHATDANCVLDASGSYTIVAMNNRNAVGGDYGLYAQRINAPVGTTSIAFGDNTSGTLSLAAVEDFAFSGSQGDVIYVRMADAGGTALNKKVQVYRPDGSLLCPSISQVKDEFVNCTLDTTGTFTLLAMDSGGWLTGPFSLYVQRSSNPVGASPVSYGSPVSGTLALGAVDDYSFSGVSGQQIKFRMQEPSSSPLRSKLRVFSANGVHLCNQHTSSGSVFIEVTCTLNTTGTHTVIVMDFTGGAGGNYQLTLTHLNP
jgi:hypothetical protein